MERSQKEKLVATLQTALSDTACVVITHQVDLTEGPAMYTLFRNKQDSCIKVVLKPH